jgi:hypothetical protein
MKRGLLLLTAILSGFVAQAQAVSGSVTMGAGYADQVYYKLSDQATNTYPHASWDIAFLRTSPFAFAARINDARNIEVYEASPNIADWATIDVAQVATWTRLYNSETQWESGAFDNGSATYGWGEYNPGTHHVTGAVVFVLKYSNGTFRKFKIDDFFGGYTFTFATWNGTAWTADQQVVLANAANAANTFNYYSLENNAAVVAEPASADWDITFTKYKTDYFGDGSFWQDVTGVFHAPDIQVAENVEPTGTPDVTNLAFTHDINAIGYDWKTFNMTTFTYTVSTDKAFYVKYANGTLYRLVFATFAGSSTGNITFSHEDVTSLLGTQTFANNNSFGVYPNPSADKKINIVYDLATSGGKNTVSVYSITGVKVYEKNLAANAGFFNQQIDLGSLNNGVYVLKFESGDYTASRKIVLQ